MKSIGLILSLIVGILCAQVFAEDTTSLKYDISALQSAMGRVLKRLDDRDTQINSLKDDVERLTLLLADQDATISEQNSRIQHLEGIIRSKSDENHNTSDAISGQGHVLSSGSAGKSAPARKAAYYNAYNRMRREYMGSPVAFLATLANSITHAGALQPIAFDRVVTNVGGAYNVHLGSFVAPVSGIYVFSTTLLSYPGHTTHFRFVKNNQAVSHLYLKTSPGQYETVSQTVVLQLNKGDDVTIRNEDPDEALHGDNYSTFAGFLIWETENTPAIVG
ncbi:complement C1q tumor necrosis factor-related protein 3-like [Mya arenaria]|nr:complement C1q tumor necrosis factor-related protein 3-like [Mya arenaria]